MKLHPNPKTWRQIVENALDYAYQIDPVRWGKIYDYYEARYLNPDSPLKIRT